MKWQNKNFYKSPKGYYYKIDQNLKKIRISEKKFRESKKVTKEKVDLKPDLKLENSCAFNFLKTIEDNCLNLILTDPPYGISKNNGMEKLYQKIKHNPLAANNSKYGKKYATQKHFGNWDEAFNFDDLKSLIVIFYKKLCNSGTLIIWIDLWKISYVHNFLKYAGFKQIRLIEWVKTNPQPINSKINYLTNSREVALLAIKGSKPVFNSEYDNGLYYFPSVTGKNRIHPTQKNLKLFETLIKKHTNEQDLVLDCFLGSGTTLYACKNTNRRFYGCEIDPEYFKRIKTNVTEYEN